MAAVEDPATVQGIAQDLEDRSGDGIFFINFPKEGRTAPILLVIVVVERPDAGLGDVEHFTPNDTEAKAEYNVEIRSLHGFDITVLETVGEAFAIGNNGDRWNTLKHLRKIDRGLG